MLALPGQPGTIFSRAQIEDKLYGWDKDMQYSQ
jgi:hypothetical protein